MGVLEVRVVEQKRPIVAPEDLLHQSVDRMLDEHPGEEVRLSVRADPPLGHYARAAGEP